jgi:hypothetical protein
MIFKINSASPANPLQQHNYNHNHAKTHPYPCINWLQSRRRIGGDKDDTGDGHRLFEILKHAGIEVDEELATTIQDEVARIKGAR